MLSVARNQFTEVPVERAMILQASVVFSEALRCLFLLGVITMNNHCTRKSQKPLEIKQEKLKGRCIVLRNSLKISVLTQKLSSESPKTTRKFYIFYRWYYSTSGL